MLAKYLNTIVCLCSDQQFGQNAVEWAILSSHVKLTGDRETDLRAIMGEPGKPETGQYDAICEAYRRECRNNEELLMQTYAHAGLLEEINRSVPIGEAA